MSRGADGDLDREVANLIVFGTCVGPDRTKYETTSRPSIEQVARDEDVILAESGSGGICGAYNKILAVALELADCEGVVLLHDDVEIVDPKFREKLLGAFEDDQIGIAGVVGGAGLRGLAWWHARDRLGAVYETRGYTQVGQRFGDADAVDGLLLAISPRALEAVRFDAESFPRFHGYDVDVCLQARASGLRVVVLPIEVLHRTKGGYGDKSAFSEAERVLRRKWPQYVRRGLVPVPVVSAWIAGRRALQNRPRRWARTAVYRLGGTTPSPEAAIPVDGSPCCPICRESVTPEQRTSLSIVECEHCGVGITWPPPGRDVEGAGIFKERYGGLRLMRRPTWHREAKLRVDWIKQFLPDGSVLEVGAATGEFVRAAKSSGYDAYGVEVSEWAANHARRLGVDVLTGYLEDWVEQRPGVRPDAIAMWHVLEHLPDPMVILQQMADLMGPGGLLLLEVPNFDAVDAELLGIDWDSAQPLDHFHHFRERSMRSLLEASHYRIEHTIPITTRPYTSSARWHDRRNQALLDGRPWPSFDLLRVVARVRDPAVR